MTEFRTVHDPFTGRDERVSDRLVDRLRGKYASGPHLPNGNPEFGWRQFQAPPIQHEAAARIEALEDALREARGMLASCALDEPDDGLQASWDRSLSKIDAALGVRHA